MVGGLLLNSFFYSGNITFMILTYFPMIKMGGTITTYEILEINRKHFSEKLLRRFSLILSRRK